MENTSLQAVAKEQGQSDIGKFIKLITESDAYKIVQLASGVYGFANTLIGLFDKEDPSKITERINQLEQLLNAKLYAVGELIKQQTQQVIDKVEQSINAQAGDIAKSAEQQLKEYKRRNDKLLLYDASGRSSQAVSQMIRQTDPYYIAGLILAGNVRVDVVRALDPTFYTQPDYINEINKQIQALQAMIDSVNQSVTASHGIGSGSYPVSVTGPKGREISIRVFYYTHTSKRVTVSTYTYYNGRYAKEVDAQFKTAEEALTRAKADVQQGIQAELAFLNVPTFQKVADTWRNLLTAQKVNRPFVLR